MSSKELGDSIGKMNAELLRELEGFHAELDSDVATLSGLEDVNETLTVVERSIGAKGRVIEFVRGDCGEGERLIERIQHSDEERGFDTISVIHVLDSGSVPADNIFSCAAGDLSSPGGLASRHLSDIIDG